MLQLRISLTPASTMSRQQKLTNLGIFIFVCSLTGPNLRGVTSLGEKLSVSAPALLSRPTNKLTITRIRIGTKGNERSELQES